MSERIMYEATNTAIQKWTVLGLGDRQVTVAMETGHQGRDRFDHKGRFCERFGLAKAKLEANIAENIAYHERQLTRLRAEQEGARKLTEADVLDRTVKQVAAP